MVVTESPVGSAKYDTAGVGAAAGGAAEALTEVTRPPPMTAAEVKAAKADVVLREFMVFL
ncbi:hypothetical protein GCM10027262_61940 [Nocardia tengchongensis]